MAEQAVVKEEEELPQDVVSVGDVEPSEGKDLVVDDEGKEIKPVLEKKEATSEDDYDEDERLTPTQAETDPEREAIRERRREEKRRKKENFQNMKRELAARDKAIADMREELNILQRKSAGGEMAQIDNALKQTQDAYAYFKNEIAEATSRADGQAVANATEKMIQAGQKFNQLKGIKDGYQKQQSAPAPLDPRLLQNAQEWMEDHDWYDPAAKDEDSDVMRTIDNRLASEGWDPKTPEYWEELTRRGQKFLPHRFSVKKPAIIASSSKPRQTVAGSGGSGSSGTPTGFVLSAARVSAIKEAGAWDDPKRRAAMIKRFKEYDRNSGTN